MADRIYTIQSSFNAGEISPEVANRSDLDKYVSALTKAQNVLIKPYGAVYKRPGFQYCDECKVTDGKVRLIPFHNERTSNYILEVGAEYIRVYKNGVSVDVEITTVFTEEDLPNLRFVQSADTMFIASGTHNIQVLKRYADNDWRMSDFDLTHAYVDISNGGEAGSKVTPSATTGNITITSTEDLFSEDMIGVLVKMWHQVESTTVTASGAVTSSSILVGRTWSILTHGTWTGTVTIQQSRDGVTWKSYRTYTGSNDTNISESGTFDELTYLRVVQTAAACTTDLTAQSYERAGTAQITAVNSTTSANATVIEQFGDTSATEDYALSVWCDAYGYPRCIGFFQDRLVLAGNKKYPSTVWMSRTGDYYNFGTEEADGQLTDDSAVVTNLLSREEYSIRNIIAGSDLMVMTEGNEWVISGSSTVKPSELNPKNQTSYGCNDVSPNMVGGRLIYVQYRGKTALDMGYTFETDAYAGNDLTLLAKHLTRGCTLTEMAYVQEPDGIAFFVTSKGTINCLTYNFAQRVYAWSTIQTDGEIMSIAAIGGANDDELYAVIRRKINGVYKRYLEKLAYYPDESDNPHDFIMLDCAVTKEEATEFSTIDGLDHLIGKEVQVLGDSFDAGKFTVDDNGEIHLFTAVKKAVIGLPYTMKIQLPNLDFNLKDGTMQGRFKKINEVFMRLTDSWGGKIGADENIMDDIIYTAPTTEGISLFTGDIKASVPSGEEAGFELRGQITIVNDEPYPFNLASVVRVVTFGG